MSSSIHPLHDMVPFRITAKEGLLCHWIHLDGKRFTEPFFEETILKCRHTEFNSRQYSPVTTIGGMIEGAKDIPALQPSAFIFHVSRCGSTLLSQLLSMEEQHIVLSEVPLFDELLRVYRHRIPAHLQDIALESAARILGQVRTGNEKHLFVKLDSWHIFYRDKFRELYPGVPFILLYRSPAEVVRSHRKLRGLQMVPGLLDPALPGLDPQEAFNNNLDDYTAKMLEQFYTAFHETAINDKHALLVNYDEGIMNIIHRIASHTGIVFSDAALRAMEQRSGFHSKHPSDTFSEHTADLPAEPWLAKAQEHYTRLDQARIKVTQAV